MTLRAGSRTKSLSSTAIVAAAVVMFVASLPLVTNVASADAATATPAAPRTAAVESARASAPTPRAYPKRPAPPVRNDDTPPDNVKATPASGALGAEAAEITALPVSHSGTSDFVPVTTVQEPDPAPATAGTVTATVATLSGAGAMAAPAAVGPTTMWVDGGPLPNRLHAFLGIANQEESVFVFDEWNPLLPWTASGVCYTGKGDWLEPSGVQPNVTVCPASQITDIQMSGGGGNDELFFNVGGRAPVTKIPATIRVPGTFFGDAGNDTITGGVFSDTLNGGGDSDTLNAYGGTDTLNGDAGHDTLNGQQGVRDILNGGADNDTFYGKGGGDEYTGGPGFDILDYGWANGATNFTFDGQPNDGMGSDNVLEAEKILGSPQGDKVWARTTGTELDGRGGNDTFYAGPSTLIPDKFWGGGARDTISFEYLNTGVTATIGGWTDRNQLIGDAEVVIGTPYNDVISGTSGNDDLIGNGGSDTIYSYGGRDFLYGDGRGEEGTVALQGGPGVDHLYGGEDHDELWGGGNEDFLYGENGPDNLYGESGPDHLRGGSDTDTLWGGLQSDELFGGSENDTLSGEEGRDTLKGESGDDDLYGGTEDDFLYGDAGNDFLDGEAGGDRLDAGSGSDTIDYSSRTRGVRVLIGDGYRNDGEAGELDEVVSQPDQLSVVTVIGGAGDDVFVGDDRNQTFEGRDGDDQMEGKGGDDWFRGGANTRVGDLVYYNSDRAVSVTIDGTANDGIPNVEHDNVHTDIENVWGGSGDDRIVGSGADNQLDGRDGDDTLIGNAGYDTLIGGANQDRLYGGNGPDLADPFFGNEVDKLYGGLGHDRMYGEDGSDELADSSGVDLFDGGAEKVPGVAWADDGMSDTMNGVDGYLTALTAEDWITKAEEGEPDTFRCGPAPARDKIIYDYADISWDTLLCLATPGNPLSYIPPSAEPRALITWVVDGGLAYIDLDRDPSFSEWLIEQIKDAAVDGIRDYGIKRLQNDQLEISTLPDGRVRIQDKAWAIGTDGTTCTQETVNSVLCPAATRINISTGEGNDQVKYTAGLPTTMNLGEGNDHALTGPGAQTVDAGPGTDTAHYDRPAGTWVSMSFDNLANDGAPGESDNMLNFESFTGGAEDDTVVEASTATPKSVFRGGGGTDTVSYTKRTMAAKAAIAGTTNGADGENDWIHGDVENLVGGAGADILTGSAANNLLRGGGGNDTINGLGGIDTVDYSDKANGVKVSLTTNTATVLTESDTLANLENVIGSNQADEITGNAGANSLWGRGGVDKLYGLGLADNLYGEAGKDELYGGEGDDILDGGADADVIDGDAGSDLVTYAATTNAVIVTLNNATNDDGADTNNDGKSDEKDTVLETESVIGGQARSVLIGNDAANFLQAPGTLTTAYGAPSSTLIGNGGKDWLIGGPGNDALDGGADNDTLTAGEGNDTLIGGGGIDIFGAAGGNDTLVAADGNAETLVCGAGNDLVEPDSVKDTWGQDCEEYRIPGWSSFTQDNSRFNGGGSAASRGGSIYTVRNNGVNGVTYRVCTASGTTCTWGADTNLGGTLASGTAPSIATRALQAIDVVVVGSGNRVYWKCTPCLNKGWSDFTDISNDGSRILTAAPGSSPEIVNVNASLSIVLVKGSDNALWFRYYCADCADNKWLKWTKIAGVTLQDGVGAAVDAGIVKIVGAGTDGKLWLTSIDCRAFPIGCSVGTWQDLGKPDPNSSYYGKPDIAVSATGSYDIVALSNLGNRLWWKIYRNGQWLPGKQLLSGNVITPTLTNHKPNELFLLTGSGNQLGWTSAWFKEPQYP
jgi:Ca2+-binding RTX toxin-like protein